MEQVKECMKVTIEFSVVTTGRNGEKASIPPVTCSFVYGVDVQYPSVEAALMNKHPGDRVQVYVPPEELYGVYDESLIKELPKEDYKQERLQPGKVYREVRKGTLVQFMVKDVRDDVVVADFNDSRAGSSAEFDILIKEIREATKSEMTPSCIRI